MLMITDRNNLPCNETPTECRFMLTDYEKRESFMFIHANVNSLLYCDKGSVKISSSLFKEEIILEGELMFIPRLIDYKGIALEQTHLVIHQFNHTTCHPENCILNYLFTHQKRTGVDIQYHCRLTSNKMLQTFMNSISSYILDGTSDVFLWNLKHKELIRILSRYYPPKILQSFFHPMIDEDVPFKSLVLSHHLKVKTAKELAELCGYGIETFRRLFNKEFQMPIYKWLQMKRAEQVIFKLSLPHLSLKEIAIEIGMSPQQFNRFCKENLGDTPGNLRERLINVL